MGGGGMSHKVFFGGGINLGGGGGVRVYANCGC